MKSMKIKNRNPSRDYVYITKYMRSEALSSKQTLKVFFPVYAVYKNKIRKQSRGYVYITKQYEIWGLLIRANAQKRSPKFVSGYTYAELASGLLLDNN